jgi:hypothetical protein
MYIEDGFLSKLMLMPTLLIQLNSIADKVNGNLDLIHENYFVKRQLKQKKQAYLMAHNRVNTRTDISR